MPKKIAVYEDRFDEPDSCHECRYFNMADGYIPCCNVGGGIFGASSWRVKTNGFMDYDNERAPTCPLKIEVVEDAQL